MEGPSLFLEQPVMLSGSAFDKNESDRFVLDLHKHDGNSEILLIEEGEGDFEIDGKTYTATAGTLLFYHRGIWHKETSTKHPFRAVYIGFTGLKIRGLEPDFFMESRSDPVVPLGGQLPEIRRRMRECIEEHQKNEAESEVIANHHLGILFARLAQMVYYRKPEEKVKKHMKEAVSKTRRWIEENYSSSVTLDTLAKTAYMNKYHLAHLFKEEMGTSPIRFLAYCRMEAAKRYLLTTNLSVKEIAGLVGYQSEPSFYHAFMKMNGLTPGEYRQA